MRRRGLDPLSGTHDNILAALAFLSPRKGRALPEYRLDWGISLYADTVISLACLTA